MLNYVKHHLPSFFKLTFGLYLIFQKSKTFTLKSVSFILAVYMLMLSCIQTTFAASDKANSCCKKETTTIITPLVDPIHIVKNYSIDLEDAPDSNCCSSAKHCDHDEEEDHDDKSCCDCTNPFCCFKFQKVTFYNILAHWTILVPFSNNRISIFTNTLSDFWNPDIWHPPV